MGNTNKNRGKGTSKRGRKAPEPQQSARGWVVPVLGVLLLGIGALTLWEGTFSSPPDTGIRHRVPGGERGRPLSPALFGGVVARAYRVASEIPEVLDKLYCYCYCIENHGHLSNLSCFVGRHAAG